MGGYALASALHLSGPIAIVVADCSRQPRPALRHERIAPAAIWDTFWELLDELLNAILFVLIGLEMLVLTFSRGLLFAGLLAIPVLLWPAGSAWACP